MAAVEATLAETIGDFLAAEFPGGRPPAPSNPHLAAIGTLAPEGLASPLLRERLVAVGIHAAGFTPFPDPAALLADPAWSLALVLSPFKREVPAVCRTLTPSAAASGVVDTLLQADGAIIGVNTNAYAAAGALSRLLGGEQPGRVLVAGTGGAARSVAVGLRRLHPAAEVGFVGRSPERSAALVAQLGLGSVVDDPARFAPDTVVNTTTVGETDDAASLAFDLPAAFGPGVRYFDLNNRTSALQTAALAAGCVTLSGIFMQLLTNALRVALLTPADR